MSNRHYPIDEPSFSLIILPLISAHKNRSGRPPKVSHYQVFCGILYVLRTGIPWRDLPLNFGNWHTVYMRFKRWSESGLFWNIIKECHKDKHACFDMVWIDSTAIKSPLTCGGSSSKKGRQSIGKTRAGWTTKYHLALSESGVEASCLSPGNHADSTYFKWLHDNINNENIRYISADKGCDSDKIRSCIEAFGQQPVIPYRNNRKE